MKKIILVANCVFFQFVSLKSQIVIQKLANINTNSQHCSPTFKEFDSVLFFNAGLFIPGNGLEPWKYDFKNTCPYNFLNLNKNNNTNSTPIFLEKINDKIVFTATDGNSNYSLWNTNGSIGNASKIIGNPSSFYINEPSCNSIGAFSQNTFYVVLNNQLIFNAKDSLNGEELWISDGVNANLLKDIEPSLFSNNLPVSSNPRNFTTVGSKVFFIANTKQFYSELWVTDGTNSGTKLVKDIYEGNRIHSLSEPRNLFSFNNKLIFTANDSLHGEELWLSDGTEQGTILIKDINNGMASSNPYMFKVFNNQLYFIANDGINGTELWTYNPSNGSTYMVKDISPSGNSFLEELIISQNKLYFLNNGLELWESDGTNSGTKLIKGGLSYASKLHPFAGKLVFNNNSALWVSDATSLGTIELKSNINPRRFISLESKLIVYEFNKFYLCDSQFKVDLINYPTGLNIYGDVFQIDNSIYFEGNDNNGYQLFRVGDSIPPCNVFTKIQNQNANENKIRIYPNPVNSDFLKINTTFNTSCSLYDSFGKLVLYTPLKLGDNIIQLLNLNNGIYFLKIEKVFYPISVQKF